MTQHFWAFISYNHADERHAKWLHAWLESYRVPKKLVGTTSEQYAFERPARLRPIYRDRDESSAGQSLDKHIKAELGNSRNLIVICSPNAVASRWVDPEIRHFQSLGRSDRIVCLIVDGDPNANSGPTRCIPTALFSSQGESGVDAIAGDIRPGKDKPRIAALRLAAGLLDVRFDELRQRDQERRVRQLWTAFGVALALLVVMGLLAFFALHERGVAQKQTGVANEQKAEAQKQTGIANDQKEEAKKQTVVANEQRAEAQIQTRIAETQKGVADEKRREAERATTQAKAAEDLAKQRQIEAQNAQRATRVQFEDATLRRLAVESKSMLEGTRAGGTLMAVRVALAGLAIKPRSDQFGTLQAAIVAGDASLRAWDVPGETVGAVAYSPDGKLIVAITRSRTSDDHLRFWRADNGEPIGAAIPLGAYVPGLAFSADGLRVITADSKGTIAQWDIATRQPAGTPSRLEGIGFSRIAVSPTGDRWVTAASGSNVLALWSPSGSGHSPRPLHGHTDTVRGAAFSPDGQRIVSSSDDTTIRVWDANTGQPIGEPILGHTGWVTSVAFSPDGQTIVSGSHDGTVRLWRLGPDRPVELRIDNAGYGIDHVRFSPDGQRVAAAAQDGFVRVWDAGTRKAMGAALAGHRGPVSDIAFAPDGSRIVSGGKDGSVRLWDGHGVAHGTLVLDGHKAQVNSIAFAPGTNDHRLAATDFDGTLRQWDADTGKAVGTLIQVPRASLNAVVYSADGTRLITASADGVVRVWNAETGRAALPPLRGHSVRANTVAASRNGKLIASGDESGQVILWDATTGQLVRRMGPVRGPVWSVGFSPDAQRVAASGGTDGLFAMWGTVSGELIYQSAEVAKSAFPNLAFSPDGRYVATSNRAQATLKLRDAHSGRPIERVFLGHGLSVEAVAFSADGRFIASGSMDQSVRLWDVETGDPIGAATPFAGLNSSLAFSADGQRLAQSGTVEGTIHVWDGPAAWARLHCQRLTRNLSVAEWDQYVGKGFDYVKQCPDLPGPDVKPRR